MAQHTARAPVDRALILTHYERALAFIVECFPLAPIVPTYYPNGLDTHAVYGSSTHEAVPKAAHIVEVGDASNPHHYISVEENSLLWLVHRGAIGFESWTPSPRDPESVGYARICLKPRGGATQDHLALAMLGLRTVLFDRGAEAVPVLNGTDGAALFIPFNDCPTYDAVREWLHGVAAQAVERNPQLMTTDTHDHTSERIHVDVATNAVGHFSSLPYVLIGAHDLPMVTPIEWTELGSVKNGAYNAGNSETRLAAGNVFARCSAALAHQRFSLTR